MLDNLMNDFTNDAGVPIEIVVMRLLGTVILCGIIGFEREVKNTSAGLRTNIMVGLAAATFAIITIAMLKSDALNGSEVRMDPIRLVEAVTNGVAFLAAGIIVFSKGEVRGLTTGASLWLAAAIGLSVGLGHWALGLLSTAGGFFILFVLRHMEFALGVKHDGKKK